MRHLNLEFSAATLLLLLGSRLLRLSIQGYSRHRFDGEPTAGRCRGDGFDLATKPLTASTKLNICRHRRGPYSPLGIARCCYEFAIVLRGFLRLRTTTAVSLKYLQCKVQDDSLLRTVFDLGICFDAQPHNSTLHYVTRSGEKRYFRCFESDEKFVSECSSSKEISG